MKFSFLCNYMDRRFILTIDLQCVIFFLSVKNLNLFIERKYFMASCWQIYSFFLVFFRAAPLAYGSSQARGGIGAVAAGLCHNHSNSGSDLHL